MEEALKNLTDNSPTDVANIALAGDIYSLTGNIEDKELGFALLAKAVTMAPNNQYLACRYAERLAAAGQLQKAAERLSELIKDHPQLSSIHLILAKIFWLQGKSEQSVNELLTVKDGGQLSSKEQEEAALMFVKTGRIYDGYKLFRQAMSGQPEKRFYAAYCGDSLQSASDDYKTALAVIEANINNNPHSDQLALEIKQAVLLLLLDRGKESKEILVKSIAKHKDNFDLKVLLSAANFVAGDSDQALAYLELAAKSYQPKI
jgi:predicted Zn-dependent protease